MNHGAHGNIPPQSTGSIAISSERRCMGNSAGCHCDRSSGDMGREIKRGSDRGGEKDRTRVGG